MDTQIQNNSEKGSKMSISYFFLSIGVLGSLITSVVSFLNLAFETLNFKFPDALNSVYQYGYNSYNYEGARGAIATLIIFFPIMLVLMKYWKKKIESGLSHADEVVRKWMIYIILFLSAIVSAVDLVILVRYFVSGEITTRFILKVAVTLLVALFVGVHYIFELNGRKKVLGFSIGIWSAIKASVWVILLVIWSFTVIGTPSMQRGWRLDERRLQDLQSIQWQVINYWQQKEKLPETLGSLADPISGTSLPVDPEFEKGTRYEYSIKGPLSFELCATFSADMPKGWNEYGGRGGYPVLMGGLEMGYTGTVASYPYPGKGGVNESWDHGVGRTCFTRTIDKDIYPPNPKPLR